jgi:CheY-like chemotaxis protein
MFRCDASLTLRAPCGGILVTSRWRLSAVESDKKLLHLLLIEDNPEDVRLLTEALRESKPWCYLTVANTGSHALDILFQRGKYSDVGMPDLIILDLNIPILTGFEVLDVIKSNSDLGMIPVIVMSTSENPADINAAYSIGASCYIVKPHTFNQLTAICEAIRDFWTKDAKLPKVIAASNSG